MAERKKRGRPPVDDPKETNIKVRVNQKGLAKLEFCKEKLGTTRAEVLRKGLDMVYDDLKQK